MAMMVSCLVVPDLLCVETWLSDVYSHQPWTSFEALTLLGKEDHDGGRLHQKRSGTMVAVTTRRSGMPRKKKRKHQVSTLESIMEWFQRRASSKKSIGLVGTSGDATAAAIAKTRTSKSTAGVKTVVTVSPSKSKAKSSCLAKQEFPVKRLLGFSKAHPSTAPVPANKKDTTQRKPESTTARASPVVKKNLVVTKQDIPHKKTAVPAKRSLGFASSLSSPFRSLASSLASSTIKLLPGGTANKQNPPRRVCTIVADHTEVMAVSHALQDELDTYLKDHHELTPTERRELRQWGKTVQNQLNVCDRHMMEKIHADDQVKMEWEKQKIRDEIEGLKRACMEAEIHAQASRLLFKIDALR
jgi:hypothetical protein